MDYEESLKNFRDWYSVITTAEKKGKAEGHAEGLAEGMYGTTNILMQIT